jgi:methylmalonyl-CoA mutase, N-terminal domain
VSISGYHIREAGSTAVQELAFTLANGMEYVRRGKARGLNVDDFAPRLSFFFNAHNDFFEEIAKYRAARRIWSKFMRDEGAKDPRSMLLRFHTQTAGVSCTREQPENNIVRVALQALAAVLGGTQSLHTNSFDEALALPTEKAVRIALRTQQIIAHESGVANTVDPVAGSYAIETLTNDLEAEASKIIADIDAMGGMLRAIEKGWVQRQIQEAAYTFQQEVERNERTVVGVNEFQLENEQPPDLLKIDDGPEKSQLAKLNRVKAERDNKAVQAKLDALRKAAKGTENILPFILDAVRSYATLGEICGTLRAEWGEYTPRADV